MKFIKGENLSYTYKSENDIEINALDDLNFYVKQGEFVAILGHNGSGKSTLAKLINGFFSPTEGVLLVNGIDTSNEDTVWEIRQSAGMVFQNPDNQLIATIVEDDVAFGLENLGVPSEEIRKRVDDALKIVNMTEYNDYVPSMLSGGQKQRVSIAGIIAMKPKCIILDEATAMLDPLGRKEVLHTITKLNREENITIVLITHYMEEAVLSDRVIILEKGNIVLTGTPREVFSNVDFIKSIKLDVPQVTQIAHELNKLGFNLPKDLISTDEIVKELIKKGLDKEKKITLKKNESRKGETILSLNNISHIYNQGTIFEKNALIDILVDIKEGEFLGIIGHTGSGKSTLIQTLNGILIPTYGDVRFKDKSLGSYENIKEIRQKIGVVFQYPEHQLFEETVYKDVAFAPINMGLSQEEIDKRVKKSLNIVGLSDEFYKRCPFDLSGGQKRRVAIAGILAMQPEILVLDEPTAGLDPFSREELLQNIKKMHEELKITIILISHSMEEIVRFSENIIVMENGKIKAKGTPSNIFSERKILKKAGILVPQISDLMGILKEKGYTNLPDSVYTVEDCVNILSQVLNKDRED